MSAPVRVLQSQPARLRNDWKRLRVEECDHPFLRQQQFHYSLSLFLCEIFNRHGYCRKRGEQEQEQEEVEEIENRKILKK
jgi:hypothetical protein